MEKKNSFVMYTDYQEQINLLSREQRGDLLTAIIAYAAGNPLPETDGITNMAFSFIKARMDKDNEKYQKVVESRREAGKKGAEAKKANAIFANDSQANVSKRQQTSANQADNVNDSDNVNDKKINTMCEANALFERLWKLYPSKKGKGQVSDTQKKRLLAIGESTLVKAIERYSLELQKDADWRKPQNGSTFFNSGYKDYLDENYVPGEEAPKKKSANKFNDFHQRTYDYGKLEKQLLERDD